MFHWIFTLSIRKVINRRLHRCYRESTTLQYWLKLRYSMTASKRLLLLRCSTVSTETKRAVLRYNPSPVVTMATKPSPFSFAGTHALTRSLCDRRTVPPVDISPHLLLYYGYIVQKSTVFLRLISWRRQFVPPNVGPTYQTTRCHDRAYLDTNFTPVTSHCTYDVTSWQL